MTQLMFYSTIVKTAPLRSPLGKEVETLKAIHLVFFLKGSL